MSKATNTVKFKAKLSRPAEPKGAAWTFLVLPVEASAKLPTRSQVTVDGKLDGHVFQATLEPDGQGSHCSRSRRNCAKPPACRWATP